MTKPHWLSTCCHADLKVSTSDEGTSHYTCSACKLPTNATSEGSVWMANPDLSKWTPPCAYPFCSLKEPHEHDLRDKPSMWTSTCTICKKPSPEKGHLNCYWKHRNDDLDTARGIVYGFALIACLVLIGLAIYSFSK